MYTYIIEHGAKLNIRTPWLTDFSKIKTRTVQRPDCIYSQFDYPNGWHAEVEQHADSIVIYSNCQLTENEDGSFSVPEQISRPS